MNANVKAIAEAQTVAEVEELFYCGFELETQKTEGMRADDTADDGEVDYDLLSEAAHENVHQNMREYGNCLEMLADHADLDDFIKVFETMPSATLLTVDRFAPRMNRYAWKHLFMLWRRFTGRTLPRRNTQYMSEFWRAFPDLQETVRDAAYETESDYLMENRSGDFCHGGTEAIEEIRARIGGGIEVDKDGSVDGFEFRTEGPCTVAEFESACAEVFTLKHEIDTKCSFHIHVSVEDVKHSYGARLQQAMIAYLARNMARVPQAVLERWADEAQINQYCKIELSQAKYSFIHWHSQGTIEFRCFGNVKNKQDGMACLQLALEAVRFAYRCKLGMEPWPEVPLMVLRDDILGRTAAAA